MPLDLLNYVFLLHLAFEAPQCVLKGFALLNSNLRQTPHTPNRSFLDLVVITSFYPIVKSYMTVTQEKTSF